MNSKTKLLKHLAEVHFRKVTIKARKIPCRKKTLPKVETSAIATKSEELPLAKTKIKSLTDSPTSILISPKTFHIKLESNARSSPWKKTLSPIKSSPKKNPTPSTSQQPQQNMKCRYCMKSFTSQKSLKTHLDKSCQFLRQNSYILKLPNKN